jgi:hypothetical protein
MPHPNLLSLAGNRKSLITVLILLSGIITVHGQKAIDVKPAVRDSLPAVPIGTANQ